MKTLIWDVDDVLAPTMATWLEHWRAEHPQAPAYADLTSNPPHVELGVPREVYLASLDAFRRGAYADMEPRAPVAAWFADHGHRFRHVALTATPRAHAPTVSRWVLTWFGDWIRTFGFVPSWRPGDERLPGYHADKGVWIAQLAAADVFLDDQPHNVAAARASGVESYVVGQPWNDGEPIEVLLERLG